MAEQNQKALCVCMDSCSTCCEYKDLDITVVFNNTAYSQPLSGLYIVLLASLVLAAGLALE